MNCDLLAAGVCEINGYCSYFDPGCPSGKRFHAHAPAGIADACVDDLPTTTGSSTGAVETGTPTSSSSVSGPGDTTTGMTTSDPLETTGGDASGSDTSTGGAEDCPLWEQRFESGKATDVRPHPDGGVLLASVGQLQMQQPNFLIRRVLSQEPPVWTSPSLGLTDTISNNTWLRMPGTSATGTVLAAFSWLGPDGMGKSVKAGPAIVGLDADGGSFTKQVVGGDYPSLRRALQIDAQTLLLAGSQSSDLWYARFHDEDGVWTLVWEHKDPLTLEKDAVAVQAMTRIGDTQVVLSGTIYDYDNGIDPDLYTGWTRRITLVDGEKVPSGDKPDGCECKNPNTGILALATSPDGAVFAAGFLLAGSFTQLWVGRAPDQCYKSCKLEWEDARGGQVNDPYVGPFDTSPEYFKDVATAIAFLPGGDVVFGGTLDDKPWLGRYRADGTGGALSEPKIDQTLTAGNVYAISPVHDGCVVVAGAGDGDIWVKQLALP